MLLDHQLTYTIYAAFNLLLVSWGFGNSHILTQDPAFVSRVASVRRSPNPFCLLRCALALELPLCSSFESG
jgi:hypothetical protein